MNIRAISEVKFWLIRAAVTRQHSWANTGQADTGGAELFMLWSTTPKEAQGTTSSCTSAVSSSPVPSKEQRGNDRASPTASAHTTGELVSQPGGLARAQELLGRRVAADRTCLRLRLSPPSFSGLGGKCLKDKGYSVSVAEL